MRNSLLATSVGLTMIHFRREIEERPPLGGLVMTALGLGYAFAGGACHLYAVARAPVVAPLAARDVRGLRARRRAAVHAEYGRALLPGPVADLGQGPRHRGARDGPVATRARSPSR